MEPAILSKLENVRQSGSGWTAHCPAHEDRRSSLSIKIGDNGGTLLKCHSGCSVEAIVASLGWSMKDLFGDTGNGQHAGNGKPKIIATYDYRDEEGTLLYQAIRFEPKDFRQRRPAPGGGWVWNLQGVRRVLFRLPELLASDPEQRVHVVEGEKDVLALAKLGFVSTCNAGGAGKWIDSYSEALRGRRVAILPDNDPPGRKHGDQVARSLQGIAREVKIVDLPGLPEKGDASDWLLAGGTREELERLIEAAPVWTPAASGPAKAKAKRIVEPPLPWRPFPIEVLAEPVRSYVEVASEAIGTDPAYVGTAILAALAGAIGSTRQVILKRGWVEPAVLWGVLVGDSGTLKSPAIDAAVRHVRRRQARSIEAHGERVAQFEQDLEDFKLRYDDWRKVGRRKFEPPPEKPEPPVCERVCCSDVTIESLAVLLADAPRGLLLIRDELSGWLGGFDKYSGGKAADVAHWLAIHGARDLVVDRKTGDRRTIYVKRAGVSIVGSIQPKTLRRVLGEEHLDNGLAARLLLAMPPQRAKKWTEQEIGEETDWKIGDLFERLYDLQHGEDGDPITIGLTRAGKAEWVRFYNRHAEQLADASGNESAVLAKLEGAAARLSLVDHLIRDDGTAIDERSIEAGVALAQWFGYEAARVYQVLDESSETGLLRQVLDLVRRRGGRITANDLRRRSRRIETTEDAERVLGSLVDAGLGYWEDQPPGEVGGRPTRTFVLQDADSVSVSETPKTPEENEVSDTDTGETDRKTAWETVWI